MIFDYIEKAYYINLDYRTDRKELFEKRVGEYQKAGVMNKEVNSFDMDVDF